MFYLIAKIYYSFRIQPHSILSLGMRWLYVCCEEVFFTLSVVIPWIRFKSGWIIKLICVLDKQTNEWTKKGSETKRDENKQTGMQMSAKQRKKGKSKQ